MTMPQASTADADSEDDEHAEFAAAVLAGLAKAQKAIPSRFLYDARGSEIFEEITRLPEYYPTRTEIGLLNKHVPDLAQGLPAGAALIEFGSGSSRKTEILLQHLDTLAVYMPVDVSPSALREATDRLSKRFPDLKIAPVIGDFCEAITLPAEFASAPRVGFFPGSTIGNLSHEDALALLTRFATLLGADGRLIIGVDTKKDRAILEAAYDDAQGVTAEFNYNLLRRMNRELAGNFDVAQFGYEATYNRDEGRVEMYLVSKIAQDVRVRGRAFALAKGERIHTENSHKYALAEFSDLARKAGWISTNVWTDDDGLFSVHDCVTTA